MLMQLNAQVNFSNINKDIPLVLICLLVQIQSATCKQVAEHKAEAFKITGWVRDPYFAGKTAKTNLCQMKDIFQYPMEPDMLHLCSIHVLIY